MTISSPGKESTPSTWLNTALPRFDALQEDLTVDVVVAGGGLTGITTAWLLTQEGVRVALVERNRLACADTGKTTAHLTYVSDRRLHELVKHFGKDGARAFWEAGAAAIDQIATITRETGAECDFRWVPGYLHERVGSADRDERERLRQEAELACELGFQAQYLNTSLNEDCAGIRFDNQAKFHPRRYLAALVAALQNRGARIFEHTELETVEGDALQLRANGHRIRCDYLVTATHNPLMARKTALGAALFQTKLSLYTSYVLAADIDPRPEALFWDTSDPYEYLRIDVKEARGRAIFGGEDVKTGQEGDPREVFARLEARLRLRVPSATVTRRWLGQVVETDDGLPFIGEQAKREFIATGFCGNGMTLGTLSAMLARDAYLNRRNPWADLLRPDRKPFHGGLWRYVSENIDYPYYLLRDRLASATDDDVEAVAPGEGRIVRLEGKKVAAFRNAQGQLLLCSPVCTHLKCLVRWNGADQTWDCPCHGSRFRTDGSVVSGPAREPLERLR